MYYFTVVFLFNTYTVLILLTCPYAYNKSKIHGVPKINYYLNCIVCNVCNSYCVILHNIMYLCYLLY